MFKPCNCAPPVIGNPETLSAVLPPDVQVHVDGGLGLDGDVRAGLLYILVDVCVSTVDLVKE